MGRAEQTARTRHIALVVEDQPEVRDLAAAILEETDLAVVEAVSADEALAFLRERASDVAMIFVDVKLPGRMDGVDLAHMAAESWPWIKVVVTSGFMDRPLDDLPRSARFMPKPWRAFDVLLEAERATLH
jgi:two-component system, response regulator PdtaR